MAKKIDTTKENNTTERISTEVKEAAHKIWLAGLGALTAAEEGRTKLLESLVEKGKEVEAKGRETVTDVKDDVEGKVNEVRGKAEGAWDKVEDRMDGLVASAFERFGVPTREEIATLTRRVEELTRVVEKLDVTAKKPAAKSTRSTKSTASPAN